MQDLTYMVLSVIAKFTILPSHPTPRPRDLCAAGKTGAAPGLRRRASAALSGIAAEPFDLRFGVLA